MSEYGDGSRVKFPVPASGTKTVTVGGSNAAIASQDAVSVTLSSAPAEGAVVAITYTSIYPSMVIVSTGLPVDADGRPDGTVYIQIP